MRPVRINDVITYDQKQTLKDSSKIPNLKSELNCRDIIKTQDSPTEKCFIQNSLLEQDVQLNAFNETFNSDILHKTALLNQNLIQQTNNIVCSSSKADETSATTSNYYKEWKNNILTTSKSVAIKLPIRATKSTIGNQFLHSIVPKKNSQNKKNKTILTNKLCGSFNDILFAMAFDLNAIRQKTDSDIADLAGPSCSFNEDNEKEYLRDTYGRDGKRIRRTSSMPTVVPELNDKLRHYNYDLKLNKLQKRALRFTWTRLQTRNGGKRIENVFDRLTKTIPILKEMFTTRIFLSALCCKSTGFNNTISTNNDNVVANGTSTPATLREYDPMRLGRAHISLRPYGFISSETMIDVILSQEAVRDLPGAGQAWVVDQLRAGFESTRDSYLQQIQIHQHIQRMLPKCPVEEETNQLQPLTLTRIIRQQNQQKEMENDDSIKSALAATKLLMIRARSQKQQQLYDEIESKNNQEEENIIKTQSQKNCQCHLTSERSHAENIRRRSCTSVTSSIFKEEMLPYKGDLSGNETNSNTLSTHLNMPSNSNKHRNSLCTEMDRDFLYNVKCGSSVSISKLLLENRHVQQNDEYIYENRRKSSGEIVLAKRK